MAIIPDFPQALLNEHAAWHNNMNMNVRSGDGQDFLEFHRYFIQKSLAWYRGQGFNPSPVEPWTSIPAEIKSHPRWSRRLQGAEDRLSRDLSSFQSADELGQFILTSSLHDAVHVLGAEAFNEEDFALIEMAPRSTLFYNWHGLIDRWYRQFEEQQN